jgi:phosphatidylinositol-3,4,5-trisphosphate 3-phosphatase/dual-specificity protein phosphatase PTEN
MDWLRSKVSGKRNRYRDKDFNLDITYITNNIMAMSFPASGMESVYRNSISSVAEFLEKKHSGCYKVINLSNRAYDPKKFKGNVLNYNWEDHHSPAINVLFECCYDMYQFLNQNSDNVAVVH